MVKIKLFQKFQDFTSANTFGDKARGYLYLCIIVLMHKLLETNGCVIIIL